MDFQFEKNHNSAQNEMEFSLWSIILFIHITYSPIYVSMPEAKHSDVASNSDFDNIGTENI